MELLRGLVAVGAGGAMGAWLRWGLAVWLTSSRQPVALGTLAANLAGGCPVGPALAWIASRPGLAPEWRLFLVTGLLGGLTTFSTFLRRDRPAAHMAAVRRCGAGRGPAPVRLAGDDRAGSLQLPRAAAPGRLERYVQWPGRRTAAGADALVC